jgi:hypothetical protein
MISASRRSVFARMGDPASRSHPATMPPGSEREFACAASGSDDTAAKRERLLITLLSADG